MIAAGWVGFGAGSLPRAGGRTERVMLAGYGLLAGLLFGFVMNLWFWPFLTSGVPSGMAFVPGDPVSANLNAYGAFYLATSLGWDLPRGVLTAVLVLVAGRPVLASLRRGTRKAAFGAVGQFEAGHAEGGRTGSGPRQHPGPGQGAMEPPTAPAGVSRPDSDDCLINKPR
jgi:energy-coupling factor transport system substrate-specific component